MAKRTLKQTREQYLSQDGSERGRPTAGASHRREQAVRDAIAKLGGDPLVKLAELAGDPNTTQEFRKDCIKAMLPYCHATKRESDVALKADEGVQVIITSGAKPATDVPKGA